MEVICVTFKAELVLISQQPSWTRHTAKVSRSKVLLIFRKPSPNTGKWDSHHASSWLFLYMCFNTKVEQQYIFKLHLKVRVQTKTPNPILIFMLVRSKQKANSEWKHPSLQCIIASELERGLEALQTAALGKARENISKHVRFSSNTYHHLFLRNR